LFQKEQKKKKVFDLIFFEIFLNQCRCVEDRENVGRAKKPTSQNRKPREKIKLPNFEGKVRR
jgi:hypothetical protein